MFVVWREVGVTTKADDNPVRVDAPGNTYTIGGLKSNTPYTITVTVFNPAGSTTSQPITHTTEKSKYYLQVYVHVHSGHRTTIEMARANAI